MTTKDKFMLAVCPLGTVRLQDRCLYNSNSERIGDDLDLPLVELRQTLELEGVECHTFDMCPLECFDGFLFLDMPKSDNRMLIYAKSKRLPVFVIVWENHFICKRNAEFARYSEFDAVFTYNDDAVSNGIAHKLNYAQTLDIHSKKRISYHNRRLAVMISSRVKKNRPHLCSYLRLRTIQFYEDHHCDDFDLYGPGWDKGTYFLQESPEKYVWLSALRLNKILPRRYYPRCWKGMIGRKRDVLGRYRFAYCYENTVEIPGYITEKIFDVMMAGTVPVYLGHPSAQSAVPKSCYVDRADFASDEKLYSFLANMDEVTWSRYLDEATDFIESARNGPFSVPVYVKTIVDVIVPLMKRSR